MEWRKDANQTLPPLILHVIFRLDMGGLENGLINLINFMPAERYRHAIVCLTEVTDFAKRLKKAGVEIICLNRRPGMDWESYRSFYSVVKRLQPLIVHTRNLGCLEYLLPAVCAGVSYRVHGEHGRDVFDLYGTKWKYVLLRKVFRAVVSGYIVVSQDLASWLAQTVSVNTAQIHQIYNGVDTEKFYPSSNRSPAVGPPGFIRPDSVVVGTIGRMLPVKDQLTLMQAFVRLLGRFPDLRQTLRLVVIGDGPLREQAMRILCDNGAQDLAWLPGRRDDIAEQLRGMDLFVLPSIAEGISNTILEAMATGLPVVATDVGGNGELVLNGKTGKLVPPSHPESMLYAVYEYVTAPALRMVHGKEARARVMQKFSMKAMVEGYMKVYDSLSEGSTVPLSRERR
jgi:sugar transferase (PEP-CTERM/EpsH1 system associated)